MALSGTGDIRKFAGDHHGIYVTWSATQNQDAISSTVTINVKYWVEAGWNINKGSVGSECTITVNGAAYNLTAYIGSISTSSSNQSKTIATKTVVIPHDQETGAASLSIKAYVNVAAQLSGTWYYGYTTNTNTWSLNTIEVYKEPEFTATATAVGFGKIRIDWTATSKYDIKQVRFNSTVRSSGVWDGYSPYQYPSAGERSGSYTIEGLRHNTAYSLRINMHFLDGTTDSGNYVFKYITIYQNTWGPGSTSPDVEAVTISSLTSGSVHFAKDNPHSSLLVLDGIIVNDSTEVSYYKSLGTGNGSGNVALTESAIRGILAASKSAATCSIKYKYSSYADTGATDLISTGTTSSVLVTFDVTQAGFKPTIDVSQITSAVDTVTRSIFDNNGYSTLNNVAISEFTTIDFTIPKSCISLVESSTLASVHYGFQDANGNSVSAGASSISSIGNDIKVSLKNPTAVGNLKLYIKVTDSRGAFNSDTFAFSVLKYNTPSIEASVARDADVTTAVHLADLQIKWTNITGNGIIIRNEITVKYGYRENSTTAEVNDATTVLTGYPITTSEEGNSHSVRWSKSNLAMNISLAKTTFVFAVYDTFGRVVAVSTQVRNSIPILRMLRDGRVSINCGVTPDNILTIGGNTVPSTNAESSLGGSNNRWKNIYLSSSPNVSSDIRLKEDIKPIDESLETAFMELEPVTYSFRNDEKTNHDRTHMGFKAQQVNEVLTKHGYNINSFALVGSDKVYQEKFDEDPNWVNPYESLGITPDDDVFNIAYLEMIPLNTHMIQMMYKKILEQDAIIKKLYGMLSTDDDDIK